MSVAPNDAAAYRRRVFQAFRDVLDERVNELTRQLGELRESSANETKNTAGDKHETALAHLQIEQKQLSAQLQEATDRRTRFNQLNPEFIPSGVGRGSLVETDRGKFLIGIAIGPVLIDGIKVTAISTASPLGNTLLGAKQGETISFNGMEYVIRNLG